MANYFNTELTLPKWKHVYWVTLFYGCNAVSLLRPLSLDVKPYARNGGCCKSFAIKENSLKHPLVRALVNNKQPNSGTQNQQVLLDQIHRIQTEEPRLSMKIPIQRIFLTFMSLHLSRNKKHCQTKTAFSQRCNYKNAVSPSHGK